MDDLAGKLSELLNNPESLEQIKGISNLLGLNTQQSPIPEPPREKGIQDALGMSPETMQAIMKMAPLLGTINQDDQNTIFLQALKPLLKDKRRKKLDEAIRMMRMFKIIPLLKQQGIF